MSGSKPTSNAYSTRIVVDLETGRILARDSIAYDGAWALLTPASSTITASTSSHIQGAFTISINSLDGLDLYSGGYGALLDIVDFCSPELAGEVTGKVLDDGTVVIPYLAPVSWRLGQQGFDNSIPLAPIISTFLASSEAFISGVFNDNSSVEDLSGIDLYGGGFGAQLRLDCEWSNSLELTGELYGKVLPDGMLVIPYFSPVSWRQSQQGFDDAIPVPLTITSTFLASLEAFILGSFNDESTTDDFSGIDLYSGGYGSQLQHVVTISYVISGWISGKTLDDGTRVLNYFAPASWEYPQESGFDSITVSSETSQLSLLGIG